MRRLLGFLAGALTGALVGGTLAVLFAPAPGETIRSDLRNRIDTLRDQLQTAAGERREQLEAQLAGMRGQQE